MKKDTALILLGIGALILLGGGTAVYTMTRGLRNNNPGNIVDNGDNWEGLATPRNDGRFLRFVSPEYGIRALARVLSNYVTLDGIEPTITALISRWAPPGENNTAAYIQSVSDYVNLDADSILDLSIDLPRLVGGIIHQENGLQPYADATIAQGVLMAA